MSKDKDYNKVLEYLEDNLEWDVNEITWTQKELINDVIRSVKNLDLHVVSKCNCETPNPNEGFVSSKVKRLCYTCHKYI